MSMTRHQKIFYDHLGSKGDGMSTSILSASVGNLLLILYNSRIQYFADQITAFNFWLLYSKLEKAKTLSKPDQQIDRLLLVLFLGPLLESETKDDCKKFACKLLESTIFKTPI